MRKMVAALLAGGVLLGAMGSVSADVGDTIQQMKQRHGEYGLVEDKGGSIWTRYEWKKSRFASQKPRYYIYVIKNATGEQFQLKVKYNDKGIVESEWYALASDITISEFAKQFPQIHAKLTQPESVSFATGLQVKSFIGDGLPTTLGIAFKKDKNVYTFVRFKVYNEQKKIENPEEISAQTIIESFEIREVLLDEMEYRFELPKKALFERTGEEAWFTIANPFKED